MTKRRRGAAKEARMLLEGLATLAGIAMPHVRRCEVCGAVMVKPSEHRLDHIQWVRRTTCGAACRKVKANKRIGYDYERARRTRRIIVERVPEETSHD